MKISPYKLWEMANGDKAEYKRLLIEHGHLILKKKGIPIMTNLESLLLKIKEHCFCDYTKPEKCRSCKTIDLCLAALKQANLVVCPKLEDLQQVIWENIQPRFHSIDNGAKIFPDKVAIAIIDMLNSKDSK